MALGRRDDEQQNDLWVPAVNMPRGPGHPFYEKLNELLAASGFDRWVEERCRPRRVTPQITANPYIL